MFTTKDIYSYTGKLYAAANTPVKIISDHDGTIIAENLQTGYRFPVQRQYLCEEQGGTDDRKADHLVERKTDKLRTQKRRISNNSNGASNTLFG